MVPREPRRPDPAVSRSGAAGGYYAPGGARNAGGYELPGIADLLAQAESAPTAEEQAPILEEMVMLSLEEGARNIVVCLPQVVTVYQDNISGG